MKVVVSLLGAFGLAMLLWNARTMTICEDETGGFYLDVRPTAEVFEFFLGNQSEDPPLYDLIQHAWLPWAGQDIVRMRIPALVFWVAMLPGIFLVGRRLGGPRAAWFSLAAVLLMPYHWTIPAVARWYALYACLVVWNFFFLLRLLDASTDDASADVRRSRFRWAVLYVLTGTCLWYTNYSAIVLFFTHLIVALGRACEKTGLAPSGDRQYAANARDREVPVPIFPQARRVRFRRDVLVALVACWAAIGLAFLPWLPTFLRQLGISTRPIWPASIAQSLYCLVAGEMSMPHHLAFSLPAAATCLLLGLLVLTQVRRTWIPVTVAAIVLVALIGAGAIRPKRLTLMSPFLALAFGLVLSNAVGGVRWRAVARGALIVAGLCVVGGAAVNTVRHRDWLAHRWLDPCREAAQRVQTENPDAVVLTNSYAVLFYLGDRCGIGWDLRETPENLRRHAKAIIVPLKPPRLARLEASLATAHEAVWAHHAASGPISKSYDTITRTMAGFGYSVVKTDSMLRAAPEFLEHHPHYRGRTLGPLDAYRVVLVHFAKAPADRLAVRPIEPSFTPSPRRP